MSLLLFWGKTVMETQQTENCLFILCLCIAGGSTTAWRNSSVDYQKWSAEDYQGLGAVTLVGFLRGGIIKTQQPTADRALNVITGVGRGSLMSTVAAPACNRLDPKATCYRCNLIQWIFSQHRASLPPPSTNARQYREVERSIGQTEYMQQHTKDQGTRDRDRDTGRPAWWLRWGSKYGNIRPSSSNTCFLLNWGWRWSAAASPSTIPGTVGIKIAFDTLSWRMHLQ